MVEEEYLLLEEYKSSKVKIEFFHNACGKKFKMTPNAFLNGRRCPHCFARNKTSVIIGQTYPSNTYGNFKILSKEGVRLNSRHLLYKIEFLNTGGISIASSNEILKGQVKDYYFPSIAGIGFLGDPVAFENKKVYEKLYAAWRQMIGRCYNKLHIAYKYYGNKEITVHKRWHCFNNFYHDAFLLPGWNEEEFILGNLQIDKDKINKNLKLYSIKTCSWLTRQENIEIEISKSNLWFEAISPEGKTYKSNNKSKFARENGLTAPNITNCLKGNAKKHKGWAFRRVS